MTKANAELYQIFAKKVAEGATFPQLQQDFTVKSLRKIFAYAAAKTPQLFVDLFGDPPTQSNILLDENLSFDLIPYIFQNIGPITTVQHQYGKGIQDTQLFDRAARDGIQAIVTGDHKCRGTKDLCGIAERAYADPKDLRDIAIVGVSQNVETAILQLQRNAKEIQSYITQPSYDKILILD